MASTPGPSASTWLLVARMSMKIDSACALLDLCVSSWLLRASVNIVRTYALLDLSVFSWLLFVLLKADVILLSIAR